MTVWAQEQPQDTPLVEQYLAGKPLIKAISVAEGAQVKMIRHGAASEEVFVNSPGEAELLFLTYYFPGWRGYVDGRQVGIYPSGPYGLITMRVPAGEHRVLIRFGDTPVRLLGALVSVVSLLLASAILIWQWVRERRLT